MKTKKEKRRKKIVYVHVFVHEKEQIRNVASRERRRYLGTKTKYE